MNSCYVAITGAVNFSNAESWLAELTHRFQNTQDSIWEIDLKTAKAEDSAILAVLVAVQRLAKQEHADLMLYHFSDELKAIARVVGVEHILRLG